MSKPGYYLAAPLLSVTVAVLAACDSSGSSSASAIELSAASTFGSITLDWSSNQPANILYSSDPDCNWDNYTVCPDSGMLLNQDPGLTLGVDDGLRFDQNYAFVAEAGGDRTEQQLAAVWAPGVDSQADATLVQDGVWYVGGEFSRVAPVTGNSALFRLGPDAALEGALQQVRGEVIAALPDGNGGWYIGGSFSSVGGESRSGLAHIHPDGTLNRHWHPEQEGFATRSVNALLLDQGVLYVGGAFDNFNGEERNNLAAFDTATGELTDWAPDVTAPNIGLVGYLVLVDDLIVFSGQHISAVNGEERSNIAAVTRDGELTSFDPDLQRSDGTQVELNALAATDDLLLIGGSMDQAEGRPVGYIAIYDPKSGDLMDWAPQMSSIVTALAVSDDTLYVLGFFSSLESDGITHERPRAAAIDLNTREVLPWSPKIVSSGYGTGTLGELAVDDDNVYIGGGFSTEHDGWEHTNLVAVDGETGDVLPWLLSTGGNVRTLAVSQGRLYAGGGFQNAGGVRRDRLAAFEVASGKLLDWAPQLTDPSNAQILSIQADAERLYVGGIFNDINDEPRSSLAAFSLSSGELEDWAPDIRSQLSYAIVNSMLLEDNTLYFGGWFHNVDAEDRRSVAAITSPGTNSSQLTDLSTDVEGTVRSLALHNGDLAIGGSFDEVNDESRSRLALVDPESGQLVSDWNPGPDADVGKLYSTGHELFVGTLGSADYADQPDLNTALAAFTGSTLELDPDWAPIGENSGSVRSLLHLDDRLIVGGSFSNVPSATNLAVYRLDDREQENWGKDFAGGRVSGLAHYEGRIYVVGDFNRVGWQRFRAGMAVLDAGTGALVR